ncbi:MAG: hypothetical protein OXD36_04865 [Rhodobacter sp.]|nr:hypothetical protein [Rhodobacter sp.]
MPQLAFTHIGCCTSLWNGGYKNSTSPAAIGEIGDVRDCFLQDSIIADCHDNRAEYAESTYLGTATGRVTTVRARGRFGADEEEVGAVMGFTDWGYWAVGWSAEPGNVYDTLERGGDRTLLQHFSGEDRYHAGYGHIDDFGKRRERLENLENYGDTWSATYDGLMSGIAHEHGNGPVEGSSRVTAEFDSSNWLNSVSVSLTGMEGDGFTVGDVTLPTIDGDCCNARKPGGYAGVTGFELDRADAYVEGDFAGNAHDAVHGVFSTPAVTGGFGALQTQSRNRPPLAAD